MKKILFFIAMVAMIAAMASAQITVSASGSAGIKFGMDLDEGDTGFMYDGSCTISIAPEIDKGSAGSEAGDSVYGQISVADIKLETGDVGEGGSAALTLSVGDITANLVLGDLTINLYNDAGVGVGGNSGPANAYTYKIFSAKYGATAAENEDLSTVGLSEASITTNAGIEAKYVITDIATIAVDFMSFSDWTNQEVSGAHNNAYAVKGEVSLTAVENLDLSVAANTDVNYWDNPSVAVLATVGYTIGIGEEDSIKPSVNAMYDFGEEALGVAGGIAVNIAGISLTANASWADSDLNNPTYGDKLNYAIALDLGLVDGLTVQAAFGSKNEGPMSGIEIHGKVAYAIAAGDLTITPSFEASYDDANVDVDWNQHMFAKAAVKAEGLIDNTTFTLSWDSNDLTQIEQMQKSTASGPMGQIVLNTQVSF